MDKAMVLDHLEQARRHVAEGEKHVASQEELVAELERDCHDSREARRLLRHEELQRLHVVDRDRLEKEIIDVADSTK